MTTRTYYRTSGGKFAGASKATKVTKGKAGGFANASFRNRVLASRGNARPGKPFGQKASAGKSLGGAAGAKGSSRKRNAPGVIRATRVSTKSALKAGTKGALRSVGRGALQGGVGSVTAAGVVGLTMRSSGMPTASALKSAGLIVAGGTIAGTARGAFNAPGAARRSASASIKLGMANRAAGAATRSAKAAGISTKGVRSQAMSSTYKGYSKAGRGMAAGKKIRTSTKLR